jgi:hypothetical protein
VVPETTIGREWHSGHDAPKWEDLYLVNLVKYTERIFQVEIDWKPFMGQILPREPYFHHLQEGT